MQAEARGIRTVGEMLLLYAGGPLLLYYLVYERHIPLFIILPFVFAGLTAILFMQSDQSWRGDLRRLPSRRDISSILGLFLICGSGLTLFAYYRYPEYFLSLPKYYAPLWLLVMVFYPLISVTTQELFYRVLYFHRYASAFGNAKWLAIAVNAAFFAMMHENPIRVSQHAFSLGSGGNQFRRRPNFCPAVCSDTLISCGCP